ESSIPAAQSASSVGMLPVCLEPELVARHSLLCDRSPLRIALNLYATQRREPLRPIRRSFRLRQASLLAFLALLDACQTTAARAVQPAPFLRLRFQSLALSAPWRNSIVEISIRAGLTWELNALSACRILAWSAPARAWDPA